MAPKVNTELERLKAKKRQAIESIYRISRYVSEHRNDPDSSKKTESLLARKKLLIECFEKISDFQAEILISDKFYDESLDDIESQYFDTLSDINELLPKQIQTTVPTNSNPNPFLMTSQSDFHVFSDTHLPSLDIPIFDGNLTDFKPFLDIFTALVDKNQRKSDVEKLCHLKTHLRGEALSLINNLPLVNSSYNEALNLLKNRYDNKTMLINHHIHNILDISSIQKCTAPALRNFVSKVKQQIGALKNLNQPTDSWDMILVCILSKKLDQFTNRAYQIDRDSTKLPTLDDFLSYLENRAIALEAVNFTESFSKNKEKIEKPHIHIVTKSKTEVKCSFCSMSGHKIYNCRKFKSLNIHDRISFIEKHKYCRLCLNNHLGKCKMTFKCSTCQKDHNALLHLDRQPMLHSGVDANSNSQPVPENKVVGLGSITNSIENVLLPTAVVQIKDKNGRYISVRCLIDSGSQINLVTSSLVEKLNLITYNNRLSIPGICESSTKIQESVKFEIKSSVYDYKLNVKCSVVEKITTNLPQIDFNISEIKIPDNIQLSDREFNKSARIDILLSANIFFQILLSEKIEIDNLILQNTLLGFIVSGLMSTNQICNLTVLNCCKNMDTMISQFWNTEKVPEVYKEYSTEQEACETHFQNSIEVIGDKYQVKLPLKQSLENLNLGDSFSVALKRFENLEKRLLANPDLFEQDKKFIDEYIKLSHAKIVNLSDYDLNDGAVYFMAHHPVIREDKKTTKLRVVFDGSMKSKDKKCINDYLHNGAVVQKELFDILILFRTYQYVILTDIKQMYRMIIIHPDHRVLQNILWREPNAPLQCLQLQTVTYGLKSSSFLATRCLVELANSEGQNFPLASQALLNNTYVDDVLTGQDTIENAIKLKNELISLLKLRSFELHKWCSNNPAIMQDIPQEKQNFDEVDINKNNFVVKTLGISYDTKTDNFKMSSPKIDLNECVTKRQVLSFISKFYDPLGLVGPVLVAAKVIMQKIWLSKIHWDSVLPNEILELWKNFVSSLSAMPTLSIPRNLNFTNAIKIELVGFCDASMTAYGAVIYARTIFPDRVHCNLICSKSRIVPIEKNKLSIPRLELNSALLLSNLVAKVFETLKEKLNEVFLYSDSSIVLSWLKTSPLSLNPYVANRVSKIQDNTSNFKWLYINTKENPADCLSRGLDAHEIQSNILWFHGPTICSNLNFNHFETPYNAPDPLPEQKIVTNLVEIKDSFFEKFSSISRLQRVVAYILRFCYNAKQTDKDKRYSGNLKLFELDNSLKIIVKQEQRRHFVSEIKCLESKTYTKSLSSLSPFLDSEGLLRVGGRLQNANISYSQKHPMILPKNSHITDIIIQKEHVKLLHAGPRQVLSSLNLNFWIINGNRAVKKVIHKCVTCFKHKAKCSEQLMGSLPEPRVNPARVFQNTGVDFCGPFLIKQSRLRKSIITKSYVALFVCFSVKAIHVELLSDLTTDCFLAAFKRFISRRGKPSQVFCDNGSTFKGANNELNKTLFELCKKQEKIQYFCLEESIEFNFIPSYSPVFGGLWEAGVKSLKFHLKRVMGDTQLTYEELNNLIIQIEGILNSRPLMQLTSDPTDLEYLTPGHFLIGAPITSFPERNLTEVPKNKLKFWKLCVHMQQHFWDRWHKDYLAQLQSRPKWKKELPNLKKGMLVLLKEDNVPSFKWQVARIVEAIPGKDSKVRVFKVRTKNGTYLRSITKIAVLPVNGNE